MQIIGLDIGGANIKLSDQQGRSRSCSFALWREPERLSEVLDRLLTEYRTVADHATIDLFAVTMTGELADCFRTKSEGVDRILNSVEQIADKVPIAVWQTAGEFATPDVARDTPQLVAAANWHVLATYAGRFAPSGSALLIDIGTTTTDLIPISGGLPAANGLTDRERLTTGELVYTGVRRTPVCAMTRHIVLSGKEVSLAAEFFATMHDVYLWLRLAGESADDHDTANGQPATRQEAGVRLARMLCGDRTEVKDGELDEMCLQLTRAQQKQILESLTRVHDNMPDSPELFLISGCGEFLTRLALKDEPRFAGIEIVSLTDAFGPKISESACAYAVACLAGERLRLERS